MAAVNFDSNDVIISEADVLSAPLGSSLPSDNTVGWRAYTSFPAGWVHRGYTSTPTSFNHAYDKFEADVQQSTAPVKTRKVGESLTLSFTLAQFEPANITWVLAGTQVDTAPGASQKGYSVIEFGGDTNLTEYMLMVEGYRLSASNTKQPIRVVLYRATVTANGDMSFDKNGMTVLPVQAVGMADTNRAVGSQVGRILVVTADATS